MANSRSSSDDDLWRQYVNWPPEDVAQVGTWDAAAAAAAAETSKLPNRRPPSTARAAPVERHHTAQPVPGYPVVNAAYAREESEGRTGQIIANELNGPTQRAQVPYFIGQEGQRNAAERVVPGDSGRMLAWRQELGGTAGHPSMRTLAASTSAGQDAPETDTNTTSTRTSDADRTMSGGSAAGPSLTPNTTPSGSQAAGWGDGRACDHPGCGRTFDLPSELHHHQRNHKAADERLFVCPDCPDKRFLFPKDLRRHRQTLGHAGRQFQCPVCLRGFVRADMLTRHQKKPCAPASTA